MKKLFGMVLCLFLAASLAQPAQFSLKLTGGMKWLNGDDYNAGIKGLNSYLKDNFAPVSGSFETLGTALHFQGELVFEIFSHFGIGLGGGYFQVNKDNTVKATWAGGFVETFNYHPKFSVLPLFLNLHYTLPVGSRLGIDVHAGPAVFITTLDWTDSDKFVLWEESRTFSSRNTVFGFQAGLGIDLKLASAIALVLDGSYNFAKISEVKGTWTNKGWFMLWSVDDTYADSFLWYYRNTSMSGTYPMVNLGPDTPSGPGVSDARKAVLNLSGIVLQAGFKITL